MKKFKLMIFLLIFSIIAVGCNSNNEVKENKKDVDASEETVKLMVSAAISLTDALEEIKVVYEKDNNVDITFNLGGSGSLAQQIQQGSPVDVFMSANQDWMDTLEEADLIITDTRADITGNKLVLITNNDSSVDYESINDILAEEIDQIAIGNPESVPAGMYSEQVLKNLNLWDSLKDKLVLAKDVRQVLTYIETGNVDIGFIYESDAITSNKIKVLATAEDDSHDSIIYPATVIKDTKHEEEASDFVLFMASEEAQEILIKHGFRK